MADVIKDGTTGYTAKVDSDNHLHVASSTQSKMASISELKNTAYSIYGKSNFTGVTETGLLYFEYTGTKAFFVDQVVISAAPVATPLANFHAKAEIFVDDGTVTTGTAGTAINTDRSSAKTLNSTIYTGNTAITRGTSGSEVIDLRLGADSIVFHFDGSLILSNGNNIFILGEVVAATDKMRCMILGYEADRSTT